MEAIISRNSAPRNQAPRRAHRRPRGDPQAYWLYGRHSVAAAVANPDRRIHRLLMATGAGSDAPVLGPPRDGLPRPESLATADFARLLPDGAVHQGTAALVQPLDGRDIDDLLETVAAGQPLVVLDQLTDPRNVGAILRSAAAFGAGGVVTVKRGGATESGALAKAAAGALDQLPFVPVVNLARALRDIGDAGYWRIGLVAEDTTALAETRMDGPVALVLGSEGRGLRRLTRENCDQLATIPATGPVPSLNVSGAAAIALYEVSTRAMRAS